MATQLETLQLIADNLSRIWDKLCEIQNDLEGGVKIDVPLFFNQYGDVLSDHEITLTEGDINDPNTLAGIIQINEIYSAFTDALFEYAAKKDATWEIRPPDPPP
jgi:hypothetical protein